MDGTWWTPRTRLGLGAVALLAVGAAGGAGAVSMTRPTVTMAPTVATPIARLAASSGVVTVKGRVAEIFGDRLIVQDATGRAMVAGNRTIIGTLARGSAVMVQGRYDDGQLRAAYLVDQAGRITEVGPRHGPGPDGERGPTDRKGPRHGPGGGPYRGDGPPPPPPPRDGVAPPPPAPVAGAPAAPRAVVGPTTAPAPRR